MSLDDLMMSKLPLQVVIHINGPVYVGLEPPSKTPFILTAIQKGILAALDGKARRTDDLADQIGDRSRLFRKGGLKELQEKGLIKHHDRLGYYRPDAPPKELADQDATE